MRINNKIISQIMNRFDFIIRYLYCRFSFIKKIMFWSLYSSDFKDLDQVFEKMKSIFENNNVIIKDKKVLELGPGNSRLMGYNFIVHGAKKVILLDKYPRVQNTNRQRKFQEEEFEFIARKYNYTKADLSTDFLFSDKISFLSGDLCELDMSNVYIIFSNSVLEHVKDIGNAIECMSKVLVKGGYMYHNIDLRDHFNFNYPFLFYKYEQDIWNKYLTKEGTSYTNRFRYDDYMHLFKKHSFEVVSEDIIRRDLDPVKLSSQFADKQKGDLEVCKLCILLRKI
ncbi:MAG: class I SAM-dependent methyltransferase [Methanosarcinaceae archaeon]|nr:class I SAM-dependent methyltransferase [Methanosarcinaceae archaeon]